MSLQNDEDPNEEEMKILHNLKSQVMNQNRAAPNRPSQDMMQILDNLDPEDAEMIRENLKDMSSEEQQHFLM
jgi:uncharacterized ferredoxin-like protein